MDVVHVEGKNVGDIFLYTLSTCGWCGKMKAWLKEKGWAFGYVDVDLVPPAEERDVMDKVRSWNPQCTFPTVVVNQSACFAGYQPAKLEEILRR